MKKFVSILPVLVAISIGIGITGQSCNDAGKEAGPTDSLAIKRDLTSPVLSPLDAIKKMHIEKGFDVKLVAGEPLVTAPVAINFDEQGRIWALEMEDYMPDTLGTGEDVPSGKVVILSDKNGDGEMDDRKIFLDSLVLPRAICLIDNGILVAEPPRLWYFDIKDDKPANKTLVDAEYAVGGNVEHQPNGLFRALDNWIYNAKSDKRYRKKGNHWLIEKTHFRGQWGISQDSEGRLFYNNNSANLLGDYFSPGLGAANEHQRSVAGYIENIVPDNRVYPAHPTPGVNRGYMEGILDDSLRLVNFTAACGPVIYNGNLFGKDYDGNAFVAEPSANLIKRDLLQDEGYEVKGKEAFTGKEFLASEDERFRPVSLYVGPDGALYIVDLYRGIIQHKTYLTPYLKNEIKARNLTKPLACGRIYKIMPHNSPETKVTISRDPDSLLPLLASANGWVRNKAQQLLIDGNATRVEPSLHANIQQTANPLLLIHSLWTLEGLDALLPAEVLSLLRKAEWPVRMQALSVVPSVINKNNYTQFLRAFQKIIEANDTVAAPYIAFLAHSINPFDPPAAHGLLIALTKKFGTDVYVADAIISNLQDREAAFYKESMAINHDSSLIINQRLKKVLNDMAKAKNGSQAKALLKEFPKGAALFQSVCQACHGADGNGVASLAPPLNNSNWVLGDKDQLIPIVLYGLTGPVKVGSKLYKSPEVTGEMPGIGGNKEYTDEDIAQVLSYIRNAWSNKAEKISTADVGIARKKFKDRQKAFTMEELNKIR